MIDPFNITKYDRTRQELEAFLWFGICVAGKKSETIAAKVNSMVESFVDVDDNPVPFFEGLKERLNHDLALETLQDFKIGCYNDMMQCVDQLVYLDVKTVTLDQLMNVHCVGPKTARFFLLHSRPNLKHIVLDTHINKWLRSEGIDAPKGTPTSLKRYAELENEAIALLDSRGITDYAAFDLNKWTEIKMKGQV